MRVSCRWEGLAAVLAEPNAADMIRDYVEELSPLRDVVPVNPDWPRLAALEAEGIYKLWACRVDGTLAGFVSFFVMPHHNYAGTLLACDAAHFLAPAFRDRGRIGYRMWRSAEAALRELGVRCIMAHDSAMRPLMPFFLALDFEPRGTLFWKVL